MEKTLYDILEVEKNASEKEIKDAFKKKAKETHPDKQGGNNAEMVQLNHAYSILSNEKKRKRYDEMGEEGPERSFEVRFYSFVNDLLMKLIVEIPDVESIDMVDQLKHQTDFNLKELQKRHGAMGKILKKTQATRARMTTKKDSVVISVLDGNIVLQQNDLHRVEDEIHFLEQVIGVMSDYNYKFEEQPKARTTQNPLSWASFNFNPMQ